MNTLELNATIDEEGQLHLEEPLVMRNKKVRVIILPEDSSNFNELLEWKTLIKANPAFNFLHYAVVFWFF